MVRSVLSHPQKILTDATAVTQTRVRKTAGETYLGGSEVKGVVNDWIASVAGELLPPQDAGAPPLWGLLLETQSQTTLKALRQHCGLLPQHTLVPNPCPEECSALEAAGCHVYEGVTHGLLHEMSEDKCAAEGTAPGVSGVGACTRDATRKHTYGALAAAGFSGFGVVWLDYCGSIMTSAGRKRQTDILLLLRDGFLRRDNALLALTFSVRGSRNMYRDEVADMTKRLVLTLADESGYHMSVHSTVTYQTRSGPIHTVLFMSHASGEARAAAERRQRVVTPGLAAVLRANEAKVNARKAVIQIAVPRRAVLLRVWAERAKGDRLLWEWIRDADWRQATPHSGAYATAGRVFTELVRTSSDPAALAAGGVEALVMDTALLPVARSCMSRGIRPAVVLEEVMFAEPDVPFTEITNNYVAELHKDFNAVWLNYLCRKAYPAPRLQKCEEWGDLVNLLTHGHLGGTLGIALPYVSAAEPWQDAALDWIITGVHRACVACSHPPLRHVFASSWVLGTPHATVVFTTADSGTDVCTDRVRSIAGATHSVKHYASHLDFRLDRPKHPCSHGVKFKTMGKILADVIPPGEGLTIREPGGFFVFPAFPGAVFTSSDHIEMDEARRQGWPNVLPDEVATQHLIVLTNEGPAMWMKTWVEPVRLWLARTSYATSLVALLIEATHDSMLDELKSSLVEAAPQHSVTFTTLHREQSTARTWGLVLATFCRPQEAAPSQ